jgi:ribosomal protein S10
LERIKKMKMTAKLFLLTVPVVLLTVCALQAKESEANTPPPPAAVSAPEPAASPNQEMKRSMRGEDFLTNLLEKIRQDDPNEAARLEKLRNEDPKLFHEEMRKAARQLRPRPEGAESDQPRRGTMEENSEGPMGMMGREKIREHMQEKETELMTWLEKNEPEKAKELTALKTTDPPAYKRRMMFEMRNYRQIIDAEQTNPALAEVLKKDMVLKQKRNELLEKIKGTTDEKQKEELTKQLKEVIGQRFDLIVQKKQLKYEELKKKLEDLQQIVNKSQAELENLKSKKAEQIDNYMEELMSHSEKLNWD